MSNVIQTQNLTRYFGQKAAIDSLNLTVPAGGVFAFLGRNGSGKTTTIRMLLGITEPTRGGGTLLGEDITNLSPELRARVGYLGEGHYVYGWMTVRQAAAFESETRPHFNHDVFNSVVDHFGLDPNAKAKSLSRGQRAGLCLALTLAPEPELLILDDPALGLDPVARRSLLEAMVTVTHDPKRTIFFSSHYIDDVERVADRIAVLDEGVLRVNCDVEHFRQHLGQWVVRFEGDRPKIPQIPGLVGVSGFSNELKVTIANPDDTAEQALQQIPNAKVERVAMSMEDAVIGYLGRPEGDKNMLNLSGDAS
ncbi:MAG: ABC transporter ATP-binding protein [Planctomycetota bacterium]|jgi:ABC-2 type transport system ATP-binding protein